MPFSTLPLNDGYEIPQIAYGSGTANGSKDVHEIVEVAIEAGFQHLDTAQWYRNEEYVGQGIKESGLDRSKLYVTTKLGSDDGAVPALEVSLKKLGLDYVDLYLIHSPSFVKDFKKTWSQLEDAKEKGLTKSIGVSNFTVNDLRKLEGSKFTPAANQIRLHPYNYAEQAPVLAYAKKHGIIIEAYSSLSPITRTPGGPVDAVLNRLAYDRKATPAQVIFLWVVAKGAVVVTTSSKRERLDEYLAVADLPPLTPVEVAEIDAAGAIKWPLEQASKPSSARITVAKTAGLLGFAVVASLFVFAGRFCGMEK